MLKREHNQGQSRIALEEISTACKDALHGFLQACRLRRQRARCYSGCAMNVALAKVKSGKFVFLGAVFAALSVAAGAFGAHSLKAIIPADMLVVFETAARYQMYHALALLIVGGILPRVSDRALEVAGWCFVTGILLFSGSLYVFAITATRWVGAITPLGGAAFLAGWFVLAWTLWQKNE